MELGRYIQSIVPLHCLADEEAIGEVESGWPIAIHLPVPARPFPAVSGAVPTSQSRMMKGLSRRTVWLSGPMNQEGIVRKRWRIHGSEYGDDRCSQLLDL